MSHYYLNLWRKKIRLLTLFLITLLGACSLEENQSASELNFLRKQSVNNILTFRQKEDDLGRLPEDHKPSSKNQCAGKSNKTGISRINTWSNGLLRTARVYVPKSIKKNKPSMVVLNIHAFLATPLMQETLTHMHTVADEKGFIVVSPGGVANSWNGGNCCGTSFFDLVDDVKFISDLLDNIESTYCVDKKRVFATGMSNGAFLTHRLGCELSHRIAAIAPVAGVLGLPIPIAIYCIFFEYFLSVFTGGNQ